MLLVIVGGGALDAPKKQLQNRAKTGRPGAVPYKVCLGHLYDKSEFSRIVFFRNTCYNTLHINGMDILGDISWFTGDGLHPSAYGQAKIAEEIYQRIKDTKF